MWIIFIALSLPASSWAFAKPCDYYLEGVFVRTFFNKNTDALSRLVIFTEIKELMEKCPLEDLKKLDAQIEPTKKAFAEITNKLPDDVIDAIADPTQKPYGDLDGSLGGTLTALKENFTLSSSQVNRLEHALRGVDKRTKEVFADVNKKCERRDHRSKIRPVDDQRNSSLCYAYSLAVEFEYKLLDRTEAIKDPISVGAIALRYQSAHARRDENSPFKAGPTNRYGGDFNEAFEASRRYGLCRESQVSGDLRFLKAVKTVGDYQQIFPKLRVEQIKAAITPNPWETIDQLMNLACPNPIKVNHLSQAPFEVPSFRERPDLVSEVQRRLLDGEIVGFSSSSIFGHAMTVVGQEPNPRTGICEFIVRNSYGHDCGTSRADAKLAKVFKRCDGKGNFIITPALLAENISSLHTLREMREAGRPTVPPATSAQ
ncbi:MAG: hypothetical protein AB7P49_04075 [Bdellovibrionales bacterium]